MADINNIKIGSSNPDAVMFDEVTKFYINNIMTFGNIIPKDSTSAIYNKVSTTDWQINDGWEIEIISPTKLAINKFKIDTWGLRQIIPANTHTGYNQFKVGVSGIDYVHKNVVCHTAGSTTPDGFTKAYGGTGGYNVYWYPGQFTSGYSMQGLVIQFGVGYTANDKEREDSLQIGKHPWDVGTRSCITDSNVSSTWADGSYRAITIGLYGGVQNATAWHDETGDAYKIYDISNHPIYIDLAPRDTTMEDPSSVECWDAYMGDTQVYHKDKTLENCWEKYGYVAGEGTYSYKDDNNQVRNFTHQVIECPTGTTILPELDDWSCLAHCKLYQLNPSNKEVWDKIREWYRNNTINGILLRVPHAVAPDWGLHRTWAGCHGFKELTLNIHFDDWWNYGEQNWFWTDIEEITLNVNQPFTSPQRLFMSMTKLKTINWTNSGYDALCGAVSIVDMFGGCSSLEEYPAKLINWGGAKDTTSSNSTRGVTLTQYAFEGCNNLKKIPSHTSGDSIICSNLEHMFINCYKLTTIEPILDVAEQTCKPSSAKNWFSGCNALTSVKIKGLNHGDWYFDGTTNNGVKHGDLSNLDEVSVQYLFNNLADLTTCDPMINTKQWYNSMEDWEVKNGATKDYKGIYLTEDGIYDGVIASITSETPSPDSNYLNVNSLQGGIITVKVNDDSTVLDGNTNMPVEIPQGSTEISITANSVEVPIGNTITISFSKKWDSSNPLVDNATLHCPSAWSDKVTDEMIVAANNKGWDINIAAE